MKVIYNIMEGDVKINLDHRQTQCTRITSRENNYNQLHICTYYFDQEPRNLFFYEFVKVSAGSTRCN
jgi:hypothetical protein